MKWTFPAVLAAWLALGATAASADFTWLEPWRSSTYGTATFDGSAPFEVDATASVQANTLNGNVPEDRASIFFARTFSATGAAGGWALELQALDSVTIGSLHGEAWIKLVLEVDNKVVYQGLQLSGNSGGSLGGIGNVVLDNGDHELVGHLTAYASAAPPFYGPGAAGVELQSLRIFIRPTALVPEPSPIALAIQGLALIAAGRAATGRGRRRSA